MRHNDWDTLFELIEKATEMEGMTTDEKGREIRKQAKDRSMDSVLDEFIAECQE